MNLAFTRFRGQLIRTARYFRKNGMRMTAQKIVRRILKNDWFPSDEDELYEQEMWQVPPEQIWHMPEKLLPYGGKISAVIPAYNGAHELPQLLDALKGQKDVGELELVVVDSGSTDGTARLAEEAGAKVIRITQKEFSHSYARKLGAENASGEYLLFMTQDALPDGDHWLLKMLQPSLASGAAAVSCYESPRPDSDLISRISVWQWRRIMCGGEDRLASLPEDTSYESIRPCAQLTDNACLIRRQVYMDMGGHRGSFAEDLELGVRMLYAGYSLALLDSVSVIHSHTRMPLYHFKRSIVDVCFLDGQFDDFRGSELSLQETVSGIAGACCTIKTFLESLAAKPDRQESPRKFGEGIRRQFNQIILGLKAMSEAEVRQRILADAPGFDDDTRQFTLELLNMIPGDYHFSPEFSMLTGRYIMHTLCPYLDSVDRMADESLWEELPGLMWQYYGQRAGYYVGANRISTRDKNSPIFHFTEKYSVGI